VTYTVNYLDVYKNGSKLLGADITATNGTSFTIAACVAGDIIQAVVFDTLSIAAGPTGPTGSTGSAGATGGAGPTGPTGSSSMVYPGAGIANSTGSAWGTSYTTSGTGTVVALATAPALDQETFSTSAAVTAGTNAQGQGALTSDYNVITTAAANPSGVTLPTATTGRRIVIVNEGANPIAVFPATGGFIDSQAINTAVTVPINSKATFDASSATQWYSTLINVHSNAAVNGGFLETTTVTASAPPSPTNFDAKTQSLLYYTTNTSANWTLNIRGDSATTLNNVMQVGQTITVVLIVVNSTTAYYPNVIQVDGSAVTPKWQGGTAISAGNASAIDIYTFAVLKTAAATFTVFASQTKFSA
jgi:hypothetical protein